MFKAWLTPPLLAVLTLVPVAYAEQTDIFTLSLEDLLKIQVKSTSFFAETLSTTSYSVTPVKRRDWQKLGVRNLGELLNHMPSTVAPLGFGQSRGMAIRGYLNSNSPTGTALRFDGVPMNRIREGGGMMALDGFDLSLLNSTELIRGPGSSLHGNDAFHGMLSLESLGHDTDHAHVAMALGAYDYGAASASGYTAVGDHEFTGGFAYRSIGDMGQPYSYPAADSDEILTATRQNARENTGGLLKYRYGQDKKFTVESTVYLQDFDAHELPGIGGRPTIGDQRDKNSSDYSDQTYLLRSAASYRVSANNSIDFMAFGWGYQDSFYADFTELNNGVESFSNREESHYGVQVHQQLSLDGGSFDGVNHFAYGYEYLSINLDTYSNKMIAPDGSVVLDEPSLPESGYNRDLHSLVVDGRYELNRSGLQVAYGLRMDAYNDFDGELSPRLGFSQPLSDSQHVHITYSQAFRAPALFELYGTQRIEPNFELQPETLQSLDLKYSLERGSSLHQITLFNNKWNQGIQIILYDQPTEFALGQYQNTGRNEAYGAEYELKMRWQAWEVDWNTSYIRSKNIESEEVFSAFPHWISDLNLGYRFNNNWSAYCNNRYMLRDLVSADLPESGESVDYLRTDVVFSWVNSNGLEAWLTIRNLFDRENSVPAYQPLKDGLIDEGRNLSTTIRYSF